ncbi:MAG: pyridoxamine 5'-phosphate oxidase family protein [Planctomycetota bacterium]
MTGAPDPAGDLEAALAHAWSALRAALDDAAHGWRTPSLATVDADSAPASRVVVLRGVDVATRSVWCHADPRSPKWRELGARPRASWCFWDGEREQLRLTGGVTLHERDAVADRAWAEAGASSLRVHTAPLPPGEACAAPTSNLPARMEGRLPTDRELVAAREHFGVIRCVAERMDWLRLDRDRPVRAWFAWDAAGGLSASWRSP